MKTLFSVLLHFRGLSLLSMFLIFTLAEAQEEKPPELKQYLFPTFTTGTIKTKAGKPRNIILNYNTVTEKMVFEQNGKYYDLIGQESVDTIYLQKRKFIPHENFFLEVKYEGKISLGIQQRNNLKAPGKPVGYGGTSELAAATYLSGVELSSGYYNLKLPEGYDLIYSPVYWVKKDNVWYKFGTAKQFLKIFPEHSEALNQFIRKNRIKFDNQDDLAKLVGYCSEIY